MSEGETMGKRCLVSIMVPTRGRPELLQRSIESVFRNGQLRPSDVEIMAAVDADDEATVEMAQRLADTVYTHEVRMGYERLHEYVNPMARDAEGEWIWLFNDDATILTVGWDVILLRERPWGVLDPVTNHPQDHRDGQAIFPIVHRSLVEAMGHFSRSNHNDTYITAVGRGVAEGFVRGVGIEVYHDRPDLTGRSMDQTALESLAGHRTAEFFSPGMQAAIREDTEKVKRHLGL